MRKTVAQGATNDWNLVSAFARVVEAGSFTEAARRLNLPKSAVSRRVARLEQRLGVRLLQRTTRSLHLTEAGETYFRAVGPALAALEEATAAVTSMDEAPRGLVRMTAPVDLVVLPDAIARFVRRVPAVQVEVTMTNRRVDLVAEGVDLALRAGPLRDSTLIAVKLGDVAFALVASPRYLHRAGTPRTAAALSSHTCIVFRAAAGRGKWHLHGPDGAETADVAARLAVDDLAFAHRLAVAGAGVAFLPLSVCARDLERRRLVRLLPQHQGPASALHVVYPSARHVPQRVALLRDHLVKEIRSGMS